MDPDSVECITMCKFLVCGRGEVGRVASLRVAPPEAQFVEVVIRADKCIFDHRVQGINDIFPHGISASITSGLGSYVGGLFNPITVVIFVDHIPLISGDTQGFPEKPVIADDSPAYPPGQYYRA